MRVPVLLAGGASVVAAPKEIAAAAWIHHAHAPPRA
jgi:hypothetical protein